jgi:hypothetical protein
LLGKKNRRSWLSGELVLANRKLCQLSIHILLNTRSVGGCACQYKSRRAGSSSGARTYENTSPKSPGQSPASSRTEIALWPDLRRRRPETFWQVLRVGLDSLKDWVRCSVELHASLSVVVVWQMLRGASIAWLNQLDAWDKCCRHRTPISLSLSAAPQIVWGSFPCCVAKVGDARPHQSRRAWVYNKSYPRALCKAA